MKRVLVVLATAGVAVGAVLTSSRILSTTQAAPATAVDRASLLLLPPAAPAGQMTLYGHIKTMTRNGPGYLVRFDPAWFTSGVTANVAQAQDQGTKCRPTSCPPVPNDNYVVDESHRLLTYLMPAAARVTVITNGPNSTRISTGELYRIVNGGPHRKLFEPLDSGIWIRVRIDKILELDQQYKP